MLQCDRTHSICLHDGALSTLRICEKTGTPLLTRNNFFAGKSLPTFSKQVDAYMERETDAQTASGMTCLLSKRPVYTTATRLCESDGAEEELKRHKC